MAWEQFMIDLAGKIGGRPVLIPSADQFVTAINDHSAALAKHYVFLQASAATQALLATKKRQYEIADANGLPVPKTAFIQSLDELIQFGSKAHFPCLLKPLHCREWEMFPKGHPLLEQKIALAYSTADLEKIYHLAEAVTPAMVVQEVIEGPDDAKLVYLSCYGRDGKRLGSCMMREIRTDPIYFGSASVVEPVDDPEADEICDRFLRNIQYSGICELEIKRDTRDGKVKLIEANPRYSVTADAAPYAGVDLGWLHYLDLIGEPVQPVKWNGSQFHHIFLMRDVRCFREYLRENLTTWRGLLNSYRNPAFFDFDFRDRAISTETLVNVFKIFFYPLVLRFRGKSSDTAKASTAP
jgi:predicted ATP-grasp superfamily ATP-dependent carboligase